MPVKIGILVNALASLVALTASLIFMVVGYPKYAEHSSGNLKEEEEST